MQVRFKILSLMLFAAIPFNAPAFGQESTTEKPQAAHEHSNALKDETSPYLLMHAHNPVNWYGWNEESLKLAKQENKLIFLSIGYSSCHWCHVMERESFLDEEIAKFLNENFVCIKVDREERPDVDAIYMESLRVVNPKVNGGWPLSMFLTPDAKPFFGGTYFPARDGERGARVGFLTIVQKVFEAWKNQNDKILSDANYVATEVKKRMSGLAVAKDAKINEAWVRGCLSRLNATFDSQFGGFNFDPNNPNRPKFPEPSNLFFLLDQVEQNPGDKSSTEKLIKTCERMMMGGILDHLGGGFHRYSVDRYWKIPHFEKMLYDNAQLATVYSRAFELSKQPEFRMVVEEMLEFVTREMQDKGGAFYSALDAESEGEEGKFYRWDKEEIRKTLTTEEFELFAKVYGINAAPNFETKYYVPQFSDNMQQTATKVGREPAALISELKPIRKKLFDLRAKRIRPLTDTKILASWNGMMIRGYADAGRILKNDSYIETAKQAAKFILDKMVNDEGRLVRTYTDGQAKLNAYAPDYACVVDGLLAIHKATGETEWLDASVKIQTKQDELFWDDQHGGYFYTSGDHESLMARAKKVTDGPVPSGNSVTAGNLLQLYNLTKDQQYLDRARQTVLAASPLLDEFPIVAPRLLISVRSLKDESQGQGGK